MIPVYAVAVVTAITNPTTRPIGNIPAAEQRQSVTLPPDRTRLDGIMIAVIERSEQTLAVLKKQNKPELAEAIRSLEANIAMLKSTVANKK